MRKGYRESNKSKAAFLSSAVGTFKYEQFINGQAISPCDLDRNLSGLDTKNNENGISSKTNA